MANPHIALKGSYTQPFYPEICTNPSQASVSKYGTSASEHSKGDVIYDRSNADINVWVNTVIRRGVHNLDIEISPTNLYFSLSCSSVSCRTLVALKLNGLSLNVSSSVDLPSLKSLHVESVQFEDPNYLMELLMGCPLLEDLKICYIDYVQDAYYLNERFNILNFPKLVRADLLHVGIDDIDILLKAACNVEFLCIYQFRADVVVPEFPNVRDLSLFFVRHNWRVVLLMLKNCPNLQSFRLNLNRSFEAKDVLPYLQFGVPDCLTSGFTKCYLEYFRGEESDLLFAKYIMQNSPSLQSMKIHSDAPNQHDLLKKLALCPRKSELCELSFN